MMSKSEPPLALEKTKTTTTLKERVLNPESGTKPG